MDLMDLALKFKDFEWAERLRKDEITKVESKQISKGRLTISEALANFEAGCNIVAYNSMFRSTFYKGNHSNRDIISFVLQHRVPGEAFIFEII